jgi:hypothetical protein
MSLHSHTNVQWAADITREIILQHKRYAPLKCDEPCQRVHFIVVPDLSKLSFPPI